MRKRLGWLLVGCGMVAAVSASGCSSSTTVSSAPTPVPLTAEQKQGAAQAAAASGAGMYSASAIRAAVQKNDANPNLSPAERKIMDSEAPPGFQTASPPAHQ